MVLGFFFLGIDFLEAEEIYVIDALRNLVPFLQFRKREKHPWRSVTFRKIAGF